MGLRLRASRFDRGSSMELAPRFIFSSSTTTCRATTSTSTAFRCRTRESSEKRTVRTTVRHEFVRSDAGRRTFLSEEPARSLSCHAVTNDSNSIEAQGISNDQFVRRCELATFNEDVAVNGAEGTQLIRLDVIKPTPGVLTPLSHERIRLDGNVPSIVLYPTTERQNTVRIDGGKG